MDLKKKLFMHNSELISYGCKNCLWRLHNQCVHADTVLKETDVYEFTDSDKKRYSGYCPEYVDFLLSLAGDSGSMSILKENYSLYSAELQRNEDYSAYLRAAKELEQKIAEGTDSAEDRMRVTTLRIWWESINENVRKGRARVADRESKVNDIVTPKLTVQQLNVMITQEVKKLEEHEKK